MIDIASILKLQKESIIKWHSRIDLTRDELPWKFIEENCMWNFLIWHEEDIARVVDIDPLKIVKAKRNIDEYNQSRNNAMEKIDEWILHYLGSINTGRSVPIHSETPGMMIDRLSIMELKRYHMLEETFRANATQEHKFKCKEKVLVLHEQITDLSNCLSKILSQLESGRLMFKVYRHLKMYNDPTLNPQLYNRLSTNL